MSKPTEESKPENQKIIVSLHSEPGTIISGFWPVGMNMAGMSENIPVIVVQGKEDGPTLWIQAAVHGDEFPASWAVSSLSKIVDPSRLHGRLILFPVAHRDAFFARQKGSTKDGLDLSHQTPGNPFGTITQQIAHSFLETMLSEADAMIDVHSGTSTYFCIEFSSFPGGLKASDKAEGMAFATDSPVVLKTSVTPETMPPRMFVYATHHGVPNLMISNGGHRRLDQELVDPLRRQCLNVMRHLGMLKEDAPKPDYSRLRDGISLIKATKGGFVLNMVEIGEWVEENQPLCRILNVFGEKIEEITCPVPKAQVIETVHGTLNAGELAVELFGASER